MDCTEKSRCTNGEKAEVDTHSQIPTQTEIERVSDRDKGRETERGGEDNFINTYIFFAKQLNLFPMQLIPVKDRYNISFYVA